MRPEFGETSSGNGTHIVGVREVHEMAYSFCGRYLPMTYPVDRTLDGSTAFEGLCQRCIKAYLRAKA